MAPVFTRRSPALPRNKIAGALSWHDADPARSVARGLRTPHLVSGTAVAVCRAAKEAGDAVGSPLGVDGLAMPQTLLNS